MQLRDDLLDPIPGPNPAGEDLRYEPVYDEIKEARRRDDDLPREEWDTSRKEADYALVVTLASETLATKSKDLWIAAWLTEALLRQEGFGGLAAGLDLVQALLRTFWDHLYPEIDEGDAGFRVAPLSWLGQYLDDAVQSVPLDAQAHGYFMYRAMQSRGGRPDALSLFEPEADAMTALTAEEFDAAVASTPLGFYETLVADLDACLQSLESLDMLIRERFWADPPSLLPLRVTLMKVQEVARTLLSTRRQTRPDAETQAARPKVPTRGVPPALRPGKSKTMVFCRRCGAEVLATSEFCPSCGLDLSPGTPVAAIARDTTPSDSATPKAPETGPDEDVQFTVYRPDTVRPGDWYPMLVFVHLTSIPLDAPDDTPHPLEEVEDMARATLRKDHEKYGQLRQDSVYPVPRGGELTLVPEIEGVEFNPPRRTFRRYKRVHQETFDIVASGALDGKTARGRLTVFMGNLIVADVPLALRVTSRGHAGGGQQTPVSSISAQPYRNVFPSYSHRDQPVVEEFESHARALGDRYLRDVLELRSGENWNERIAALIERADIFQLFWSTNSMRSPYVREEYQHALSLGREFFVRPVYWETPLPESSDRSQPPPKLRNIHFQRIFPLRPEEPPQPAPPAGDAGDDVPLENDNTGAFIAVPYPDSQTAEVPLPQPPQAKGCLAGASRPSVLLVVFVPLVLLIATALWFFLS